MHFPFEFFRLWNTVELLLTHKLLNIVKHISPFLMYIVSLNLAFLFLQSFKPMFYLSIISILLQRKRLESKLDKELQETEAVESRQKIQRYVSQSCIVNFSKDYQIEHKRGRRNQLLIWGELVLVVEE